MGLAGLVTAALPFSGPAPADFCPVVLLVVSPAVSNLFLIFFAIVPYPQQSSSLKAESEEERLHRLDSANTIFFAGGHYFFCFVWIDKPTNATRACAPLPLLPGLCSALVIIIRPSTGAREYRVRQ